MKKKITVVLVVLVFLSGCAWLFPTGTKPYEQMTAKEKSVYFMSIYNKQFDDTMSMATTPDLPDTAKQVVKVKKELLTKVKPLIGAYDLLVAGGGIPTAQQEADIIALINQLATAGAK